MSDLADLAGRKEQLVAQCDLDRMRLTHALLVARHSISPFAGGGPSTFAGRALGLALPVFGIARRYGIVRVAAFGVALLRALRNLLRRRQK